MTSDFFIPDEIGIDDMSESFNEIAKKMWGHATSQSPQIPPEVKDMPGWIPDSFDKKNKNHFELPTSDIRPSTFSHDGKEGKSPEPEHHDHFELPTADIRTSILPHNHNPHGFDVDRVRKDFPILSEDMVWFDNAATTQKPLSVLEAIHDFSMNENSNIHRGAHAFAKRATELYEHARQTVANFIGARSEKEIVFVRGATEAINLVAQSFGGLFLQEGADIIVSYLEHHSNILPWQILAKAKKANLRPIPIDKNGDVILDEFVKLLSHKTKIVALTQAANAIGTVLPIAMMSKMAKEFGAYVLIDAAQSIPHMPVNVQDLKCDFLVFSGHKLYGPTGIGVLFGREELLNLMPPYQTGGGMIEDVSFDSATFMPGHSKFEAGTPNVAGAIGLEKAIEYIKDIGLHQISEYEKKLTEYALSNLSKIPHLNIIGQPKERISVVSFVLNNIPHELFTRRLDEEKIALRIGHHCSLPTVRSFGHEATIRPSFAFYNTQSEIDQLVRVIQDLSKKTFSFS